MKKYILLSVISIGLCTNIALATGNPSDKYKKEVSYPSAPSYTPVKSPSTLTTTTQTQVPTSNKAKVDAIARAMLKAAEQRNDNEMQAQFRKLMSFEEVTGHCDPQIVEKRTPQCPPIKIKVNGRTLSGSKCAVMCYLYNDKRTDVGWCK